MFVHDNTVAHLLCGGGAAFRRGGSCSPYLRSKDVPVLVRIYGRIIFQETHAAPHTLGSRAGLRAGSSLFAGLVRDSRR